MSEPNIWAIVIPAASGIAGAFLGAWLSRWNEQRKQRLEFAAQQLREFYSPILATRTHIRAVSVLRLRIEQAHGALGSIPSPRATEDLHLKYSKQQSHHAEAQQLAQFNNTQFETVLLPLYEKMLATFQDKYWLADETTRPHYQVLLEYVELWKRHLAKTIPGEVLTTFDVREHTLEPFYENLDRQFSDRQKMLKMADPSA